MYGQHKSKPALHFLDPRVVWAWQQKHRFKPIDSMILIPARIIAKGIDKWIWVRFAPSNIPNPIAEKQGYRISMLAGLEGYRD